MQTLKLVAIDLDGTLLREDKTVSERTKQTIQQCVATGIHIVIATTRSLGFVQTIYQDLRLHDPIICTSGAEIWETLDGPLWMRHTIPQSAAASIAKLADENGWWLSTTVNDIRYWLQQPNQKKRSENDLRYVSQNIDAIHDDPVRIVVKNTEGILAIAALCEREFADVCRPEIFHNPDGSLESLVIVAPQADKGQALGAVCKKLNIPLDDVMAIGDNNNDVPMLKMAGVGVAMGNALDNIKQQADIVTDTNENDGVAKVLERYLLGETS